MGTRFLEKNDRHAARERSRIGDAWVFPKASRDPYPQTPRQLNGNPSPAGLSGKMKREKDIVLELFWEGLGRPLGDLGATFKAVRFRIVFFPKALRAKGSRLVVLGVWG